MTVIMLDRDYNKEYMEGVGRTGARIRLIPDGDVVGAIASAIPDSGIDMLLCAGAAPEGVLAAAALKCMGGEFQGRLRFRNEEEKERAKNMGITDPQKKLEMEDLVKGKQVLFAATGVTDGTMLKGVRFGSHSAKSHSVIMRSLTGTVRFIETEHNLAS